MRQLPRSPQLSWDAEKQFYEKYNANPFRGLYELSEEATECYEEARKMVADFSTHPVRKRSFSREMRLRA